MHAITGQEVQLLFTSNVGKDVILVALTVAWLVPDG